MNYIKKCAECGHLLPNDSLEITRALQLKTKDAKTWDELADQLNKNPDHGSGNTHYRVGICTALSWCRKNLPALEEIARDVPPAEGEG